jgi:small-conductance mechanosensitive channel
VLPNSALSNQALENITYYPTRRAEVLVPFPLRVSAEDVLPRLVQKASALPHVLAEPAPDARIQDFRDHRMNVLLGAWCDTEHHPNLMAALALVGKQVMDEALKRQPLTPKSPRGDAAFE